MIPLAGVVLLALAVAGPFVLIATAIVAIVTALIACAVLIVLAGALLAAPLLLVRHLRDRHSGHASSALRSAFHVAGPLTSTTNIQRNNTP